MNLTLIQFNEICLIFRIGCSIGNYQILAGNKRVATLTMNNSGVH